MVARMLQQQAHALGQLATARQVQRRGAVRILDAERGAARKQRLEQHELLVLRRIVQQAAPRQLGVLGQAQHRLVQWRAPTHVGRG